MINYEDFIKVAIKVGVIEKVLCVTNLEPRKIGPFLSEVLTLGVPDNNQALVGGKLF